MKELRFHGQAIVTGRGSVDYLKKFTDQNVFIVTGGKSVFNNGFLEKVKSILTDGNCRVEVYAGVPKNPPVVIVTDGLKKMQAFAPDVVIGLGGGSAIDAAKVMSVFYEQPKLNVEEAFRTSIPQKRDRIIFVAIPTTSGTASEVTCFAVLTFKKENIKVGGKSPAFVPDIAILDADVTLSMPKNVAAETGMDAMTHAVECYTNPALEDFTQCLASGAVEGLFEYLPLSYKTGSIEAREKVHNYQCIAGCAFANVGTGMDHGIAHAFGGLFDLAHGLLNAVALPYVLQYNSRDKIVRKKLAYLAKRIGKEDFITAIKELNATLGVPKSFKEIGISEKEFKDNFAMLVENSLKGSTPSNPVSVSREDMEMILIHIYQGQDIK